jgi:hypothetical protein
MAAVIIAVSNQAFCAELGQMQGRQTQQAQPQQVQAAQPVAQVSSAKPVMIDDFETGAITNSLGGKTNVFVKAPSKAMVSFRKDTRNGKPTNVLMIRYEKKAEGGPYDLGGWCGYYTLLKKSHPSASVEGASPAEIEEDVYFDASQHKAISMWIKGDKGGENFVLGVADAHWDKVGDSVKSQEIGKYLPTGKITTDWQKVVVPLDEFFIDYSKLSSISIAFDSDCFPEGAGSGKVYIDDIEVE